MPDLGRTMVIKRRTTFKIGLVLGAIVMYLFDPESGSERRGRLSERIVSAPRTISRFVEKMAGAVGEAQARVENSVDGHVSADGSALESQRWSSAESEVEGRR